MLGFFYGQTEYSLLENTIHIEDYVNHGVENNFPFLTITDSNMYGHYKFFMLCQKNHIKPIIGLKTSIVSSIGRSNNILLYAKNHEGYQNLVHIATEQAINGVVSDDFIQSHSYGLFLVTAALDSDLDYLIYEQKYGFVKEELFRLKELVREIYIGIMPSSFMFDTIYQDVLALSKKYNVRLVPVEKCSYSKPEDEEVYQAILKIGESSIVPGIDDLHLKTAKDIEREFCGFEEALENLEDIYEEVAFDVITTKHQLPHFQNAYGLSSRDYLYQLCHKGLKKRLGDVRQDIYDEYAKRLEFELSVIQKMGYEDYFLIVWDFVRFAKTHGVLVGPGRGSAAGSLVAYSIGITEIDPIRYHLLFERFLNPERISMPDIDMDFPDDKRDFVISYVKEKYGLDHVCYITAFGTFQMKSSIRDLFRVYGYDQKYIEPIIHLLEQNPNIQDIQKEFGSHPELLELISIAKRMENLPRHISTHAAGIILSDQSLFDIVPLREGLNTMYQAQLEASDLEKMGLLKIDFLGIRNLSIVNEMILEIKKTDSNFNLRRIPLNDPKTFELLCKGDTLGVFQLESAGITKVISKMQPTDFEDIVAVLALYRPGPMENIDVYIERKHGKQFSYLHPLLEPILKDTFGIIIYQEQIMRIAQVYAGYSLGEADLLRRAVSKKLKNVLEEERAKFVLRSEKNGYDEKISNDIYDYIVKFANYGFNRSHSVAYGLFTYQMAYLKANYPAIFLSKLLNNVIGNDSELSHYIQYCEQHSLKILSPDINQSGNRFEVSKNGLLLPINAIHNIGSIATKKILEERKNGPFKNFFDFKNRMGSDVNGRMLTNLINACAFDSFGKTHSYMLQNIESAFEVYISESEALENVIEFDYDELRKNELEALGFNLKFDIFKDYEKYKKEYRATDVIDLVPNKQVNLIGLISKMKTIKTKNNEEMAFLTVDSNHTLIDVVVFHEAYEAYQDVFVTSRLMLLNGVTKIRNDKIQIQLNKIKVLK